MDGHLNAIILIRSLGVVCIAVIATPVTFDMAVFIIKEHSQEFLNSPQNNKSYNYFDSIWMEIWATTLCVFTTWRYSIHIDTIQGRAKQSCLTGSGITIRKLPPHHIMCVFNIHITTIQGRAELSNLEWYYYPKVPPNVNCMLKLCCVERCFNFFYTGYIYLGFYVLSDRLIGFY